MPLRCVVNFAKIGIWRNRWYPRGQARLKQSLQDCNWKGQFFAYTDETDFDVPCPSHQVIPYAFKTAAIETVRDKGYTSVLWCDASVFAIRPIEPVFEYIEQHGHMLFYAGFNCAQFTNDTALLALGVTRDEAEKMPMYLANCMGFDLTNPQTAKFVELLKHYTFNHSEIFRGKPTNELQTESQDPRCQGHRHDQAVGSVIAAQLGLDLIVGHDKYFAYYGPKLYEYGGSNDMSNIKEEVVLLAQGMMS